MPDEQFLPSSAIQNVTIARLEDQLTWYDRKSSSCERAYKRLKLVTMVSAVLIPVFSVQQWGRIAASALGMAIVLAEGLQQLNQYQTNWLAYRSTCESLKHEKFLFLLQAGPYSTVEKPVLLLAERTEAIVSQENAKWVSTLSEAGKNHSQPTSS